LLVRRPDAALRKGGSDEEQCAADGLVPADGLVHTLLTELLTSDAGPECAAWTAHLLLGAVRADLLHHLINDGGMTADQMRSQLTAFVEQMLPTPD
jgi:hypothetical protein